MAEHKEEKHGESPEGHGGQQAQPSQQQLEQMIHNAQAQGDHGAAPHGIPGQDHAANGHEKKKQPYGLGRFFGDLGESGKYLADSGIQFGSGFYDWFNSSMSYSGSSNKPDSNPEPAPAH
ncbi:MAG TPA: hypothetical protein VI564_06145 [Candidatus Nanoarchaeia archaeon]|nr:hypothetical protein [Candidatus Nanoarchaeia archaeon]